MAHAYGISSLQLVFRQYAGGEMWLENISLPSNVMVDILYNSPVNAHDAFAQLLMLAILLEKHRLRCRNLQLTYTPYLRDRGVHDVSGIHILQKIVQVLQPRMLTILDAHSTISVSQFISPQHFRHDNLVSFWADFILQKLQPQNNWILVAADHGAAEKTHHLARLCRLPCVVLSKRRQDNHIRHRTPSTSLEGSVCLLVDDMVDTGETLISAAQILRECGAHEVQSLVTHWLVKPESKQLGTFQKQFTKIYTTNSVQRCEVVPAWQHIVPLEDYLFERYLTSLEASEIRKRAVP